MLSNKDDEKSLSRRNRLSEPIFQRVNLSGSDSADFNDEKNRCQHCLKTASLDSKSDYSLKGGCGENRRLCVKKIKCVFVGDAKVGKTSLIVSYTTNGYPKEYAPTAFDNFSVLVKVDKSPVQLQLCDTAGQEGFDNLRPLCYPNTDVFALCFNVVEPESFYNLHTRWLPEIRRHSPQAQLLLVGTQSDRRTNVSTLLDLKSFGETVISENEAKEYCREIGALKYVECSALTQCNLKSVFDACILTSLKISLNDAGSKSRIEKAKNGSSDDFSKADGTCSGRKSFRKLKDKMKRSNSVDSSKYTSVQIRRQLSSGRINQCGASKQAVSSFSMLAKSCQQETACNLYTGQTSFRKKKPKTGANCKTLPKRTEYSCILNGRKAGSDNGFGRCDNFCHTMRQKPWTFARLKKNWRKLFCVA